MMSTTTPSKEPTVDIAAVLQRAVDASLSHDDGEVATYIPELKSVDKDLTNAAIVLDDGRVFRAGSAPEHTQTLQSVAKLIVLAGCLDEHGVDVVFSKVGTEPSGESFASIARLASRGPKPSNPMVNAGAITLCGLIPGAAEDKIAWIEQWATALCGTTVRVNSRVLASERRTGDRNRSIAYLLRSTGSLEGSVDETLDAYFGLCSLETTVEGAAHLGCVLATGGLSSRGTRVLSAASARNVVALMASCGMYDESGTHLVNTGVPAKSGVSGVIVGAATGHGGIGVFSPRLNARGGSVRGHIIIKHVSDELGWHFANPRKNQ